ncbi:MAG: hypothetical protein QGG23_00235 [Candidatus Bathyarchaeota archaeon]|jgi:hypothetical protein|nr:hypothetical protein [Candidatus Bathyarchaeota archaeon]MDP7443619.1 hypothetical protein [Candidatus Bathyarchaeota archaeon]|tara:strand:+ start:3257 stop:3454 length:198 start_codon:yes stop_codon:yes gene_type:complete
MSDGEGLTLSKLAVNFFGVIVLALGLIITYYSIQADVGFIDPDIFAPVGVLIALAGGVMVAAWEE